MSIIVVEPVDEEEPRLYIPDEAQMHFWPLNEKYQGANLVTSNANFTLHGVTFDNDVGGFFNHKVSPLHFSGESNSYASVENNVAIDMRLGFSVIASVYRLEAGDFPIFEWNVPVGNATRFWVVDNRFYLAVFFESQSCPFFFFLLEDQEVEIGKWYTVAVSYDHVYRKAKIVVDGVAFEKQGLQCGRDVKFSNNFYVHLG